MDPTQIPLRDVHLPDALGIWPLAPGWWLVIGIVTLLCIVGMRRALRDYRVGAARRAAMRELKRITNAYEQHGSPARLATEVSELLRRAMLAYSPRESVAGLTGRAWIERLDRDLALPRFHGEVGRWLLELPYSNPETAATDVDVNLLIDAARMRLITLPGGRP